MNGASISTTLLDTTPQSPKLTKLLTRRDEWR
ncbi:hypothetical protein LINPERPRIM_LOCUS5844 [Linum perenne]